MQYNDNDLKDIV